MRHYLALILIVFLFASFAPAGVGTARLSCISQSGRTLFEAEFEEYTTLEHGKLTVDKESMPFYPIDHCYVTFDPEVKVYTLNIESEANSNFDTVRYVQLWAVPASFHEVSTEGTEFRDIYKFDAKLKARDPRKGKEFETPVILISCRLTYSNP
jgi:hypothetical protein